MINKEGKFTGYLFKTNGLKSSFSPSNSISGAKNYLICCQCIKEVTEHTFKTVDKKFEIRVPLNCESKNWIYIVICSDCKEEYIGKTQTMLKERLNTYRQYIRQPELQQIDVEGHIRTCGGRNFKIMLFFAVREDSKILRYILLKNSILRWVNDTDKK